MSFFPFCLFFNNTSADVRCVFLLGVRSSSLSGNDAMDITFRLTTSHVMDADRMSSALTQDFKLQPPALESLRFACFFSLLLKNIYFVIVVFKL